MFSVLKESKVNEIDFKNNKVLVVYEVKFSFYGKIVNYYEYFFLLNNFFNFIGIFSFYGFIFYLR